MAATRITEPHPEEYSAVLTHSALKGIQTVSIIAPPLLLINSLYRKRFTVPHFLRSVAVSTFTLGPGIGVGLGAYRMVGMGDLEVKAKAMKVKSNVKQQRCDDYSVIGGVLGALATTTIFLKRARLPWLIGSGAALGVAGGVIAHTIKDIQEGEEIHPVQEVKGAVKGVKENV